MPMLYSFWFYWTYDEPGIGVRVVVSEIAYIVVVRKVDGETGGQMVGLRVARALGVMVLEVQHVPPVTNPLRPVRALLGCQVRLSLGIEQWLHAYSEGEN